MILKVCKSWPERYKCTYWIVLVELYKVLSIEGLMSLVGHNLDLCEEGPRCWSMREEEKSYFEISRRAVETEASGTSA